MIFDSWDTILIGPCSMKDTYTHICAHIHATCTNNWIMNYNFLSVWIFTPPNTWILFALTRLFRKGSITCVWIVKLFVIWFYLLCITFLIDSGHFYWGPLDMRRHFASYWWPWGVKPWCGSCLCNTLVSDKETNNYDVQGRVFCLRWGQNIVGAYEVCT